MPFHLETLPSSLLLGLILTYRGFFSSLLCATRAVLLGRSRLPSKNKKFQDKVQMEGGEAAFFGTSGERLAFYWMKSKGSG